MNTQPNILPFPSTSPKVVSFVPGLTYSGRSIGDYNCVWLYTVVSRTAKQVTLQEVGNHGELGEPKRFGIRLHDGIEHCSPHGRYSMSLSLAADNVIAQVEEI